MIIFTVPGRPQGKARPRFTRAGHAYTPKTTHDYEKAIREAFLKTGEEILDCPVHVLITAIFAPPKSISKKKREAMLAGEILPTIRPDTDNVAKAVLDALNGYAYHDDKQVTSLSVFKTYGLDEGITIIIKEDKG